MATARMLVPGVLLQQALFPDLECAVQIHIVFIYASTVHVQYMCHPLNGEWKFVKMKAFLKGPMEKQETEMKRKLAMETGNGNWKWKWEQKIHQLLVQCFLHSVLGHYSCIQLSNGSGTGFMSQ